MRGGYPQATLKQLCDRGPIPGHHVKKKNRRVILSDALQEWIFGCLNQGGTDLDGFGS